MIKDKKQGLLDPRTKLFVLITISIFVLGQAGGSRMWFFNIILTLIPLCLLVVEKEYRTFITYSIVYVVANVIQYFILSELTGLLGFLMLMTCGIIIRLLPGIIMGKYLLSTTKVSEFIYAMERMNITNKITIPISVVFRFFPTIKEECSSINDAMKMRGIRFGGGKTLQMIEYRMIPMMTSSVRIGEELSAAALTRGLGSPIKRTFICKIGFRVLDYVILTFCTLVYFFWIYGLMKG